MAKNDSTPIFSDIVFKARLGLVETVVPRKDRFAKLSHRIDVVAPNLDVLSVKGQKHRDALKVGPSLMTYTLVSRNVIILREQKITI